ncbi:VOC family protein [Aquibaculum arenosum]|uniref:VOC family protein n=1 Tax=Aquibaculum arenosum TaxID=3032591 RepID=A0ABT5YIY5_9PROT|nr:VOC family protein [Fodinicurvata sp. CAU 1616]MDF2094907.1 VOC family protein [Fodinicurvata sp. CAU 1616]
MSDSAASATAMPPFHMAFPVADLEATRSFYLDVLGCGLGREAERWIDFDFFGHQISAHLRPDEVARAQTNEVDGDQVPVRHFGAILEWDAWHALAERLKAAETAFIIEPHIRFKGQVGEQATMFFTDPSGNALEFKAFKDPARVFAR